MAMVEERKYKESEEYKDFDRDIVKRHTTFEFEENEEEEPEKNNKVEEKLVIVKNQECGLDRVRSTDGHTFRVEHDAAKKGINIMFDKEVKEPISREVDRRAPKAMKRTRQRSVVEERMDEFFMPKNVKTSTLQPPDDKSFMVGAKHIKKAAKKARQRATNNDAEAIIKDATSHTATS